MHYVFDAEDPYQGDYDVAHVISVYGPNWEPKAQIDHPTVVFETLKAIATDARRRIGETEHPDDLFRVLRGIGSEAMRNTELPPEIRKELFYIGSQAIGDLKTVTRDRGEFYDAADVGHLVLRDTKHLGHVPLTQDDLDQLQIEKPVDLRDEMPDLEDDMWRQFDVFPTRDQEIDLAAFKGGASRKALKRYHLQLVRDGKRPDVQVNEETLERMLDAEEPIADHDIILAENTPNPVQVAKDMGADVDGVEFMKEIRFPHINQFMGTRDLASNRALLTRNKLYYCTTGLDALDRGEAVSAMGPTPGIFGREAFIVNGRKYYAANTFYRLVRTVCEGKHTHFNAPQYNFDNIPLGRYWNVLIRGWLKNHDCFENMAKAYSCAKQMGVTDAQTPFEFWEGLVNEYPDFDYSPDNTPENIARWIVQKYITFVEKRLRRTFGLRSEIDHFTSTDDTMVRVEPGKEEVPQEQMEELAKLSIPLPIKLAQLAVRHAKELEDREDDYGHDRRRRRRRRW